MNEKISYHTLTTMEEMHLVKQLDVKIWNMDPVPEHQTITAVKNGGIMLGAFDADALIGFSYSFPGFQDGEIYLCSHMLGVDPAYQSHGIGEQMKWKQREIAIEKGFNLMKWTYDPLETKNGKLNLTKLNGVCHTYIENCYGEMTDKLNQGLPSDRFEVHWYLNSPYVAKKQSASIEKAISLNTISWIDAQKPVFNLINQVKDDIKTYSVYVPKDFQSLKKEDKQLALQWRMKTRGIFQTLFNAGYTATAVKEKEMVNTYYFTKKDLLQIEEI